MQCIILAAGEGTRMGELTKNCPKPMLPVRGRAKLAYTIEGLPSEINEVILIVGYLQEQIRDFFGKEYQGRKIKYIEQKELNGTAGAVDLAKNIVRDRALILMGDDLYLKSDLEKLLKYPQAILVYKTNQAEQFGLVDIDKESNLTAVIERPHGQSKGLVNTGAYVLSPEYFQTPLVPISKIEFGLPQTLVSMYPQYKTKVVVTNKWLPIGSPENLKLAEAQIDKFMQN
jgi:bifunctional UDP-N-acetylglucosamine pyrophosphorylase/glucosamine-1-phosphate N-acetyltransferase